MSKHSLPHEYKQRFLTDAGMETELVFIKNFDLPCFAAFPLLQSNREVLRDYYERFAALAVNQRCGFVLESPTWRANPDWGAKLNLDLEQLAAANRDAVKLMEEIREQYQMPESPFLISGSIGPRGDGYAIVDTMSADEAEEYHRFQTGVLADAGVDYVSALTLTYPDEAVGVVRAAKAHGKRAVISFTTETDGRIPNGQTLESAIAEVDAATDNEPAFYMINCAHPDHFSAALDGEWVSRIGGMRANASRCSHEELDACEVLDDGDPREFGQLYSQITSQYPSIRVLGGCCGTDYRHVEQIAAACC